MLTVKEFQHLKEEAGELTSKADRAEGMVSQLKERLKKEFDCKSTKQAKFTLRKLLSETNKLDTLFQKKLKHFKKNHEEALEKTSW